VGQDLDRVLAAASAPETKEAFKQQSARALERGIFGSPGFVVDGDLFWGDDRLEDALAHAAA
jgi:2-hydroxychromene-2-carboxylate isomerase